MDKTYCKLLIRRCTVILSANDILIVTDTMILKGESAIKMFLIAIVYTRQAHSCKRLSGRIATAQVVSRNPMGNNGNNVLVIHEGETVTMV